jgi:hypothetical protein
VFYTLHDALVKLMPGNLMTPSLAASWTLSEGRRVYAWSAPLEEVRLKPECREESIWRGGNAAV